MITKVRKYYKSNGAVATLAAIINWVLARSLLEWYWKNIESGAVISEDQLQSYLDGARELGLEWSR